MIDDVDLFVLKLVLYLGTIFTFIAIPFFHFVVGKWYLGLFPIPSLLLFWLIMWGGLKLCDIS